VDDLATHKPFIDAIAEDPDDDTDRLVYADWLDEHGHPGAEYLRLEVELNSIDPPQKNIVRYRAASNRLTELTDRLDTAWLHKISYDIYLVSSALQANEKTIGLVCRFRGLGESDARKLVNRAEKAAIRLLETVPRHLVPWVLLDLSDAMGSKSGFEGRFRGWE
jgi:uncharacterized protein (TIGR02996 family)